MLPDGHQHPAAAATAAAPAANDGTAAHHGPAVGHHGRAAASAAPPPETLPPTLPATGSSDATPLVLFGLVLVPMGVVLVALTRRRARLD